MLPLQKEEGCWGRSVRGMAGPEAFDVHFGVCGPGPELRRHGPAGPSLPDLMRRPVPFKDGPTQQDGRLLHFFQVLSSRLESGAVISFEIESVRVW